MFCHFAQYDCTLFHIIFSDTLPWYLFFTVHHIMIYSKIYYIKLHCITLSKYMYTSVYIYIHTDIVYIILNCKTKIVLY